MLNVHLCLFKKKISLTLHDNCAFETLFLTNKNENENENGNLSSENKFLPKEKGKLQLHTKIC